jgi:hypothetical protein
LREGFDHILLKLILFYRSLFSAINDVKLEEANAPEDEPTDEIGFSKSSDGHRTGTGSRGKSMLSPSLRSTTPPKIDKRLTEHYVSIKSSFY